MGLGTLNNRSAGQTILDTFFNDIHGAMNGDFVGRNTSGVPTSGQNLGTIAVPWGVVYSTSLVIGGNPLDTSQLTAPANRVISGKKRSTSNQPAFITPSGSGATATLAATSTNLVLDINGSTVSVAADIALSGLTLAPSSNNTATVNDAVAAGQEQTRRWGEVNGPVDGITVTSMGSNITALVGKYAAFKIGTEYFLAFVESTTKLSRAYRGFFYNSSLAPLNRVTFSNSATITLQSLGWVFVENNGTTVGVTYTNPTWSFTAPTSPATNDYWYDMANSVWKRYDGASWAIINRTFVGWVVLDATNCVAARCADFYAAYDGKNTIQVGVSSTSVIAVKNPDAKVSVAGSEKYFGKSFNSWNMTTQLAASADMYNATEQASTLYYLYVKDTGDFVISDITPYYRADLYGQYHPHNPWRAVGVANNDGSSNITWATMINSVALPFPRSQVRLHTYNGQGATSTKIARFTTVLENVGEAILYADSANLGATFTILEDGIYAITHTADANAANDCGLSLNSTELTTAVSSITAADRLSQTSIYTNGALCGNTWVGNLKRGDVLRVHTGGITANTASHWNVTVTQIQRGTIPAT